MTVNTTDITSGPYNGNDVTTEFSYDFRVENKNQLIVYETDDAGVEATLVVDTNYTVNNIGTDGGGTITRIAGALPTGYQWYIRSNYQATQGTDFASQGGFFSDVHEAAMDKLTFLIQQLNDRVSRAFRLPDSYSGSASTSLPSPEPLKFFRWNAAGDALENTTGTTSVEASDIPYAMGSVESKLQETVSVKDYGAIGDGSDESVKLRSALVVADSLGVDVNLSGLDIYAPNLLHSEYPNTRVLGPGKLSGAYRRYAVTPGSNKDAVVYAENFNYQNLLQLNTTNSPVAVLVGDSISTYSANTRIRGGMLTDAVERKVKQAFPSATYHNRAVGGTTYNRLDSVPTANFPDWYTVPATPWLDYIEALTPDIVLLSFGMNDVDNLDSVALDSIITKINAWSKVPSIVFCTPLVPSLDGKEPSSPPSIEMQEGRDFAAGYVRTFAQYYNYPLLDFNRLHNMARDGFDVVYGGVGDRETGVMPIIDGGSRNITGSKQCYNWACELTIDETAFPVGSPYINIFYGATGSSSFVQIKNIGGFYRFVTKRGITGAVNTDVVTSSEAVGVNAARIFVFEKYGNKISFYEKDSSDDPIISLSVVHVGSLFFPLIQSSSADTTLLTSAIMYYDTPAKVAPTITDFDLWGDDSESFGEYGGSGFNHPSTFASTNIYEPILRDAQLKHYNPSASSESLLLGLGNLVSTDGVLSHDNAVWGSVSSQAYYNISASARNYINLEITKDISFTSVTFRYISDNTLSTDIVFGMSIMSMGSDGARVVDEFKIGTVTLTVDGTNNTNTVIGNLTGGTVTAKQGDQFAFFRDGANGSDTYGDLKLIGVTLNP